MKIEAILIILLTLILSGIFLYVFIYPIVSCLLGYITIACDGGGYS